METRSLDDVDRQLDEGKSIDNIIMTCVQTTAPNTAIDDLNTIMDKQEDVIVSGLDNARLNTEYIISELEFNQGPGDADAPVYFFTLILERKFDVLGT